MISISDSGGALLPAEDRAVAASPSSPSVSPLRASIPSATCVGFTGTQRGCTSPQFQRLQGWLGTLFVAGFEWMRNGDCIGADAEAAAVWHLLGLKLFLHPPLVTAKRAFLKHDEAAEPLSYLERNQDIVRGSALLVATPAEMEEQRRGGTWSTVRFARRLGKPILLILPDGGCLFENHFAQAIEARRTETGTGSVGDESAVAKPCAQNPGDPA